MALPSAGWDEDLSVPLLAELVRRGRVALTFFGGLVMRAGDEAPATSGELIAWEVQRRPMDVAALHEHLHTAYGFEGSRQEVVQAVHRATRRGVLVRLARGVFGVPDFP